ncbi:MAG: hypothetical protein N5P05_001810 [Chroococcopsis gigantea SAG 12.99]|jgi:ribosomal protein L40E|nr:hypothetical protein [Chroococcopsis gigantea SAG 12.99]
MPVEEKTIVPTVLIGIGGTGNEILSRVRRLVEESYGSLDRFPVISFLIIDTDKDYKITNPESAGTAFKDNEKLWATVSGKQVKEMIEDMDNYPWISSWFPNELEKNITSIQAGAGQIRACGRFAFFCNYKDIQKKFLDAVGRAKGHENFMLDRYGMRVSNNAVNVFTTGSLSGGTGSGMLIDLGYCIRNWLGGEENPLSTAIVPMPNAFAGVNVGDRVLSNGYAALMELSYYSDDRTVYNQQFSSGLTNEVTNRLAPFDFTYLVGTKNGERDFNLAEIREMIAQNIFLDMVSDFAPHKRSIRDNIKGAWAARDPGGRGYPKQFMSLGISSIEIPISQIRNCLAYRLAKDLMDWWLNEKVILPPQMVEVVRGEIMKGMRLTEAELVTDLAANKDRPLMITVSEWIKGIKTEVAQQDWLQCTQNGLPFTTEKGKVLRFLDEYLTPKVDAYKRDNFIELSPDRRVHGEFLKNIYINQESIIQKAKQVIVTQIYELLEDRNKGVPYVEQLLASMRSILTTTAEKFRRDGEQVWEKNETTRQGQYEKALTKFNVLKNENPPNKARKINETFEEMMTGLEGSLIAIVGRKTRAAGVEVIDRLLDYISGLETRFNAFKQKVIENREWYSVQSNLQADSADALKINGLKLYDRDELNLLYKDFIEQFAQAGDSLATRYEAGLNNLCARLSATVLKDCTPLWKDARQADEYMKLFDIPDIPEVRQVDFKYNAAYQAKVAVINAPESSKLKTDLSACDRLFKIYNNDADINNNLRIAYQKSKPLIELRRETYMGKDANFTPLVNQNAAILGGKNTSSPAGQKILPKIKEFIPNDEDIKPLGPEEKHRIVFVQEVGGFSLRCVNGMKDLRQSYQDWKGEFIIAKRAQQVGENRELPIPVHLQKNPPYWDIFPDDDEVYELIVTARAFKLLFQETNKATGEPAIRYEIKTAVGLRKIDLATNWEDAIQVLEVRACRPDKEEIQRQVNDKIKACKTPEAKKQLYYELVEYLKQRAKELEPLGGEESPLYKREDKIILDLIEVIKPPLDTAEEPIITEQTPLVNAIEDKGKLETIFCTNCGHNNPLNSNFCSKCGTKLVKS